MKHFIFFFCLSSIIITKETNGQNFVSLNSCFYTLGRTYSPQTLITQIPLIPKPLNIPTCCDLCRNLTGCAGWTWDTGSSTCFFYKDIAGINYNVNNQYYSGKNSALPTWTCNEVPNKWYYDAQLSWGTQTSLTSLSRCCEVCFTTATCVSYMFNSNDNSCYHSTKNYVNAANIAFNGFYVGTPTISMSP